MNVQNIEAAIPVASAVIRGRVVSDGLIEVGGRGGELKFRTPDAHRLIGVLPLGGAHRMLDLYELSFEDILDYLDGLSRHLRIETNAHLQRARDLSYRTAPTTPSLVDRQYAGLWRLFERERVRELADRTVGIGSLEGWIEQETLSGHTLSVRCFGTRTLHIVAGNAPMVSAMTIVRNAVLRSDAIIKAPSNDPFTALAIAETMCEFAPDHPITKHLAGLLSEASLVHLAHLEGDTPKPEGSSQMPQGPTLDTPTGNPMEGDAIVAPI